MFVVSCQPIQDASLSLYLLCRFMPTRSCINLPPKTYVAVKQLGSLLLAKRARHSDRLAQLAMACCSQYPTRPPRSMFRQRLDTSSIRCIPLCGVLVHSSTRLCGLRTANESYVVLLAFHSRCVGRLNASAPSRVCSHKKNIYDTSSHMQIHSVNFH